MCISRDGSMQTARARSSAHHRVWTMSQHNESHVRPLWDEALPIRVDAVVRIWSETLRAHDPWATMLLDDVAGELRALVTALVNAACDDPQQRRRGIALTACDHGRFRRAQRFPKRLLGLELASLREAIRRDLEASFCSAALIGQTIDGLVPDLRLARRCATRAYDWDPLDSWMTVPERR
jgi:hypothetical protein